MLVRGRTSDSGIAAPTTPDNGVARRHPSPPMGCRLLLCWGFILSLGSVPPQPALSARLTALWRRCAVREEPDAYRRCMPDLFVPLPPSAAGRGVGGQFAPDGGSALRRADWLRHPSLERVRPHLEDPATTDVFVNGPQVFVDRGHGPRRAAGIELSEADARDLAVSLIAAGGRHIDESHPCVDVRLDGGARVHAVLPPVSVSGTLVSIRVPRLQSVTVAELGRRGMFDATVGDRLRDIVAARENVLVTGAAGAGKTTLLSALLSEAGRDERILTIEDVAELRLEHPHHVRLEARQPNLEGAGGITLARLVREALRMRPDRLVVGECRGEEIRELLSALNTGHDGGAGTVHANSLGDVPARLEALGALAGLTDHALARQVTSAISVVIHVTRDGDGIRRIGALGRPTLGPDGRLHIEELS